MRKKKTIKKILITLIVILILGAGTCCAWFFLRPGRAESVKVYPFDLVGMTEFWGDTRESYGPVSTDRVQTVFLSDTQTVLDIPVKEGQEIKKGDLLMSFDTTLSQLELERKDLEMQKLALDLEEAEKELQRINWMTPMSTPPTEPETEPTLYPDFGRPLYGNFEAYREGGHDGSTPDSAFVCWIWDGLVLTREFLQEGLGQLVDESMEETTPTESAPTESAPTESNPTESAPTESNPTESAPTESTPTESTPTESVPPQSAPTESTGGYDVAEAQAASMAALPTEAAAMRALLGNEALIVFSDLISEDFETEIIPPPSSEAAQPSETVAPTQPEATPPASSEPTSPSSEPAAPSSEPTNPSSESTDPSSEPTGPSSEPTSPSSEPTDPSSEPTGPSSEPTDPSSEPTGPSSEPTDPSSEPTNPSSEPTDPSSEPTDPSEESTDPSEESTEPTEEEEEDDEDKMCYPYYVIFKVTRDNMLKGDVLVWQGVHVHPDGSISFFDASGIEDYSIPEEPDEETEPTIDYIGSGYTYSQIVKMRQEQEKKIADLKLQQRLAEADYKIMERELSDGNVYAELDGKVLSVLTEEDAKLNSQPLIKLSGGGGFYVDASVSELERENISVGMEVTVNDWEGGGTYTGVISSIGDIPTSSGGYNGMDNPNASSYPFRVFVDEGADLRAGGYVSVEYSSSSSQNGVYLQNPFLRTVDGRSFVYVKGEDGLLEERTVTTGKSVWGSYTEIVDGLTADDMVAFPYGKNVRPGAPAEEGDLSDLYGY